MQFHYTAKHGVIQPSYPLSQPAVSPHRHAVHPRQPIAAAQAADFVSNNQPQQPTVEQQQQQNRQQLKSRIQRRAKAWNQDSPANAGLVGVRQHSSSAGAAARVKAELQAASLTRIVAYRDDDIPKAVNVINLATSMINNQYTSQQQQEYEEEQQRPPPPLQQQPAHASTAGKKVLVFQPVKVEGVLVAPPALPEGATALYTYAVPADNAALQAAMAERAKMRAAPAAGTAAELDASSSSSSSSGSSAARPSASDGAVGVSSATDAKRAASAIAASIRTRGWAEVTCYGGPLTTRKAVEAIVAARRLLHSRSRQDVAAVFLEFWKKEKTVPGGEAEAAEQQQAQGEVQHEVPHPDDATTEQDALEPIGPLPFRCATFLVVRCAKNKPAQLAAPVGAGTAQPAY